MHSERFIDLWFPVLGDRLPADHGYALYGALCRCVPALHEAGWWGLHTIRGRRLGDGTIALPKRGRLGLRVASDRIGAVLGLAGTELEMDGHRVRLAPPNIDVIAACPALSARLVTIKGFLEAEPFNGAVRRKLDDMEITGDIQVGARKVIRVSGRTVVGF